MNVTEKAVEDLKGKTKGQLIELLKSINKVEVAEDDPTAEALTRQYEIVAKEMLSQMIDKTENPAEIYLVPVFDGEHDHVWCDTPAPGEGMREEDATRYVREDIYLALQAQVEQLKSEITGMAAVIFKTTKALIEAADTLECELLPALEDVEPLTDLITSFRELVQATPAQCLVEIKAQAGRDGYAAALKANSIDLGIANRQEIVVMLAEQYADKLRQQAKGE